MKLSSKCLSLVTVAIFLGSGCTKKNTSVTPDKKKEKITKELADKKDSDKASNATPKPAQKGSQSQQTTNDTDDVDGSNSPAPDLTTGQQPPNSSTGGGTKPVSGPADVNRLDAAIANTPVSRKAELEKCIKEKSDGLFVEAKSSSKNMNNPTHLSTTKETLKTECKLTTEETITLNSFIMKTIIDATLVGYPNSQSSVSFFAAVEAKNISLNEKQALYQYYQTGVSVQSQSVQLTGSYDKQLSNKSVVSYKVDQLKGNLLIKSETAGTEPPLRNVSLAELPKSNLIYSFSFNPQDGKKGILTIIEGQSKIDVDFTVTKGNLIFFKISGSIAISLTTEAWNKALETQVRNIAVSELKELEPFIAALIITKDPIKNTRSCALTLKGLLCSDPDFKAKVSVDPKVILNTKL